MAFLTTKGWVLKDGVVLTGALAVLFENIIHWLNDESKNTLQALQKNTYAIIKIRLKLEEVFCEAYIYPINNIDKEFILLKKRLSFYEHIYELKELIGKNKEISEKLIII